jgi:tetratricopeptide (TPR) repeat protein
MSDNPAHAIQLHQAVGYHQEGRLSEAQELYNAILATNPHHADALHLLGVTYFQQGFFDKALTLISQSIHINPENCLAYTNIGNVLQRMERYKEAITCYDCALNIDPRHTDAFFNRGIALHSAHRDLEALASYDGAIAIRPDYAAAHQQRGNILQILERHAESVLSFDAVLIITPDYDEAHFNRANSLHELGRFTEALSGYDRVIVLQPGYAQAHTNRGNTLHRLGRDAEAVASYDEAIVFDHEVAQTFYNRGVALQLLHRNEDALNSYSNALRIRPNYPEALNNCGNTFQSLDLYQDALTCYQSAQTLDEHYGDAHWNEALCRLKTGDFESGWEKYEWRWHNTVSNPEQRRFTRPAWCGTEDLHGKKILLHAEQGFGDTIQFCRYAKLVAGLGAEVVLEVHQSLAGLMKNLAGVTTVTSRYDSEEYDLHCPLLSLPRAFGTRLATIPATAAYLNSDPLLAGLWRNRFGTGSALRIGIVWSGNPENKNDATRSAPLPDVSRILRPDINWFSLQKELSHENEDFLGVHGIEHRGKEMTTFSETAALIDQLDVVISVDTAVAHLAAAMGKPTWILLGRNADFRWLLGRRDSPWYPSVRLFRQPCSGDWGGLFDELARQLSRHFDGNSFPAYQMI